MPVPAAAATDRKENARLALSIAFQMFRLRLADPLSARRAFATSSVVWKKGQVLHSQSFAILTDTVEFLQERLQLLKQIPRLDHLFSNLLRGLV